MALTQKFSRRVLLTKSTVAGLIFATAGSRGIAKILQTGNEEQLVFSNEEFEVPSFIDNPLYHLAVSNTLSHAPEPNVILDDQEYNAPQGEELQFRRMAALTYVANISLLDRKLTDSELSPLKKELTEIIFTDSREEVAAKLAGLPISDTKTVIVGKLQATPEEKSNNTGEEEKNAAAMAFMGKYISDLTRLIYKGEKVAAGGYDAKASGDLAKSLMKKQLKTFWRLGKFVGWASILDSPEAGVDSDVVPLETKPMMDLIEIDAVEAVPLLMKNPNTASLLQGLEFKSVLGIDFDAPMDELKEKAPAKIVEAVEKAEALTKAKEEGDLSAAEQQAKEDEIKRLLVEAMSEAHKEFMASLPTAEMAEDRWISVKLENEIKGSFYIASTIATELFDEETAEAIAATANAFSQIAALAAMPEDDIGYANVAAVALRIGITFAKVMRDDKSFEDVLSGALQAISQQLEVIQRSIDRLTENQVLILREIQEGFATLYTKGERNHAEILGRFNDIETQIGILAEYTVADRKEELEDDFETDRGKFKREHENRITGNGEDFEPRAVKDAADEVFEYSKKADGPTFANSDAIKKWVPEGERENNDEMHKHLSNGRALPENIGLLPVVVERFTGKKLAKPGNPEVLGQAALGFAEGLCYFPTTLGTKDFHVQDQGEIISGAIENTAQIMTQATSPAVIARVTERYNELVAEIIEKHYVGAARAKIEELGIQEDPNGIWGLPVPRIVSYNTFSGKEVLYQPAQEHSVLAQVFFQPVLSGSGDNNTIYIRPGLIGGFEYNMSAGAGSRDYWVSRGGYSSNSEGTWPVVFEQGEKLGYLTKSKVGETKHDDAHLDFFNVTINHGDMEGATFGWVEVYNAEKTNDPFGFWAVNETTIANVKKYAAHTNIEKNARFGVDLLRHISDETCAYYKKLKLDILLEAERRLESDKEIVTEFEAVAASLNYLAGVRTYTSLGDTELATAVAHGAALVKTAKSKKPPTEDASEAVLKDEKSEDITPPTIPRTRLDLAAVIRDFLYPGQRVERIVKGMNGTKIDLDPEELQAMMTLKDETRRGEQYQIPEAYFTKISGMIEDGGGSFEVTTFLDADLLFEALSARVLYPSVASVNLENTFHKKTFEALRRVEVPFIERFDAPISSEPEKTKKALLEMVRGDRDDNMVVDVAVGVYRDRDMHATTLDEFQQHTTAVLTERVDAYVAQHFPTEKPVVNIPGFAAGKLALEFALGEVKALREKTPGRDK